LSGCRQHNLKSLDVDIPLGKLTVITGPSGSGKSSLAFHTLYAEGQRRYVETFSPYVRQFFDRMDKPEVDLIEGIPPAIAVEQKNHIRTTRSTVGTLTEINDYLKLLFPRLATAIDPSSGEEVRPDSPESAAAWAVHHLTGHTILITFPLSVSTHTQHAEFFSFLNAQGYLRILHEGKLWRTDENPPSSTFTLPSTVSVLQDRITLDHTHHSRLREALETAFHLGKGVATVHSVTTPAVERTFSSQWTNPKTGFSIRPPTPALFSFHSPVGACPKCRGFGRMIGLDLTKAIPDPTLSLKQHAIKPFQGERGQECRRDLFRHCRTRGVPTDIPWEELDQDVRDWIYYGDNLPDSPHQARSPEALEELWNSGAWYGIQGFFDWLETKTYKMHVRVFLSRFRSYTTCPACRGSRLQPESLCFQINGKSLPELNTQPISELLPWVTSLEASHTARLPNPDPTLSLVLSEITSRLQYLQQVGLGYLTLDRPTRTLSGGEIERVNLTTCLGASLTGTLFVLDEPTVGLHPVDTDRLVGILHGLRDKGNTLVVVEHESTLMHAADHLIDLGPAAGTHGGELMYQGPPPAVPYQKPGTKGRRTSSVDSQQLQGTLPWLMGHRTIPIPTTRRPVSPIHLTFLGASQHNLRKLDVSIPLHRFVCLTGVSGSGKSTLAHNVIYQNVARQFGLEPEGECAPVRSILGIEHLSGVEPIDQSAVTRTPRSTPAVFLGAFDSIRQLFATTPDAKAAGLQAGHFSFNSGNGRCDRCMGNGFEKVEMQFLSDLYVTCPDCDGTRYKPSTLDFLYHGRSIAQILDLTATDAITFYETQNGASPSQAKRHQEICHRLAPLVRVGLGYLKLGQPLNTLSGGEAQRLKLCQLLHATEQTSIRTRPEQQAIGSKLLILDEPTTGLHVSDIEHLLRVFHDLVEAGHSLLVIEHNLDVIKSADWVLDLGPEAGEGGGQLVGQGTPEHIAEHDSPTGRFLRAALDVGGMRRLACRQKKPKPAPSSTTNESPTTISLRGARHHNLKNISLDIPHNQLVVISGLSGSGKSTLAFDILFAEGQRRFLDSMSPYARHFAEQLEKPEVDQLHGLPATVAIEQRVSQGGGKSTVATVTELWNFIRLLYSKLGTTYCPDCQVPVEKQSIAAIESTIRGFLKKGPVILFAPIIRSRKGFHTEVATWASKQGFTHLLVDGQIRETAAFTRLERFQEHDIDVEIARFPCSLSGKRATTRTAKSRPSDHIALTHSIERALDIGKGLIRILSPDKTWIWLSTHSACPSCQRSFENLDPRLFSFNSPHGWCPKCRGHGQIPKRRFLLDASRYESVLEAEIAADRILERMEDEEMTACPACDGSRLNPIAANVRLLTSTTGISHQSSTVASLANFSIDQAASHFSRLTFADQRQQLIARDILPEIHQRLAFLQEVGLGYLQLNRSGNTLSGGESQRIRLAAQLGSNLRGVLYVLDEPTIGLHPRDNAALLQTLFKLRDHGNSLVIVEHDEETIAAADHLIDLGPAAGRFGGEVVYQGPPPCPGSPFPSSENSPTLRALHSPLVHPIRGSRRAISKNHPHLLLKGCHANNLKGIDVSLPLGRLTVLTGISGSGKSTLMHRCLAAVFPSQRATTETGNRGAKSIKTYQKATGSSSIKACYEVDQSPIGKTSRSCPATYVKVFDHIRELFAQLPEARTRGYDTSRFSFNTEGGRCSDCKGNGRVKLEMDFLPSTWVHCETCDGKRYNSATLEVAFRDKNIGQVLAMTIEEAAAFFVSQPRIADPLRLMVDTGLAYLQLGQPSPTLSGGEAQRMKLVSELIKGRGAKSRIQNARLRIQNLYLIEEPTVGLHPEDIRRLIDILHRLVDEGHTVVVIEHHMAIAAEADWILDLGPEAGDKGGRLVAQGTPEKVAASKQSATAPFLRAALAVSR
jgi:excinuclease ABC subunit A